MRSGTNSAGFGRATALVATQATGNNNIDSLLIGTQWANKNISFSFTNSFSNDYEVDYPGAATHASSFIMFNTAQQEAARNWIGTAGEFYRVSSLKPNDLTGVADREATIRMAISNDPATAYAYYPWSSVQAGDIWIGTKYNYTNPIMGTYAYYTLGHELGHTLGLGHGHESGGMREVAMNFDRDSMEFSIMTYRSYIGAPTDAVYNAQGGYAQTLMMYDIAAIQHMYGARFDATPVNSNYTFSTATGEMFINGIGQGIPYTNTIFRTVWDGSGVDTFDFSNYSTNLAIDLAPGSWIDLDVGGNFQRANLGNGHYSRAQVFNALQYNGDVRSLVENAQGGLGDDTIMGNTANNTLMGGAGNDTLHGMMGNDTLIGWSGIDTLSGGLGNDSYFVGNAGDIVTEEINEGNDNVNSDITYILPINVESLTLTGTAAINATGNSQNNIITGNSADNQLNGDAGNDTLNGEVGNDILIGWSGADTMTGGLGNDTYFVENTQDKVVEKINGGTDSINSILAYTLPSNVENLTLGGTAAINGKGNGLANVMIGNNAANQLNGGTGNDILDGGLGANRLTGGKGNDIFRFTTEGHTDAITDYNVLNDTIQLEDTVFTALKTTGTLDVSQFKVGAQAADANDFIIYNKATGELLYDIDGNGATAATQIAIISLGLDLINADIVVV